MAAAYRGDPTPDHRPCRRAAGPGAAAESARPCLPSRRSQRRSPDGRSSSRNRGHAAGPVAHPPPPPPLARARPKRQPTPDSRNDRDPCHRSTRASILVRYGISHHVPTIRQAHSKRPAAAWRTNLSQVGLSSPAAILACSGNQSANSAPSVPSVGAATTCHPGRRRGFECSPACDDVDAPVNSS
jgi:hypothetical protein